jgi:GON domain
MQPRRALTPLASLIVIAGCGDPGGNFKPPATDGPATDAASDAPAPIDAPVALDRNCAEVKSRLATSADGRHWIDPDLDGTSYKPFAVYCGGMSTATPFEYLELARTSSPGDVASANYSTYATGNPHRGWACNCGAATTLHTKVRINPVTLVISNSGIFTVFSADTDLACLQATPSCASGGATSPSPYAIARSCRGNLDANGRANVDLRDMPFHIAGTNASMFKRGEDFDPMYGFTSAGSAEIDTTRKVVTITGGGDCGGFGAYAGIPLAQDL